MSPAPYGVSVDVWVRDQVNRVERVLFALEDVTLRIEEVERLERALARAHSRNLDRLRAWRKAQESAAEEERLGEAEV